MPNLHLPNAPMNYERQWGNQQALALEKENQLIWTSMQQLLKFIVPSYTTAEKITLANMAGQVVFDKTLGKLCVNTGSGWETITSAP